MTLIVSDGDYEALRRLVDHHHVCRVCVRRGGGAAGLRGCAVGHLLAVRAGDTIDRLTRDGTLTAEGRAAR